MARSATWRDRGAHALRFGLLAAWCGTVWVLSDTPDPADRVGFAWPLPAWTAHVLEYMAGGFLMLHALAPVCRRRPVVASLGFGGAWAVLDEWHQSFVPGRFSSLEDVAADLLGVSVGLALHVGFTAWLAGRRPRTGLHATSEGFTEANVREGGHDARATERGGTSRPGEHR